MKKRDGGIELLDHDADVVHPFDRHRRSAFPTGYQLHSCPYTSTVGTEAVHRCDGGEVSQIVFVQLRRIVWVAVFVLPLTASPAPRKTAPTRDAGEKEQLTGVSALLHRTFASVEEIDEWTAQYTKCCGCKKPVVLARGTKEAVVIICSRTSGPLTSETFVFDKHKNGYRFMLLRNLLYRSLTAMDDADDIVLVGGKGLMGAKDGTPILRIPWSGVGAE